MTVSTDTLEITHSCDGVSTAFPVPFYFLQDSDLVVTLKKSDGTDTVLVLGTHYTVSGAGNEDGGAVTTLAVYASGNFLHIERVVAITQETAYQDNDPFPAKAHETALDKLTMICQQMGRLLGFITSTPARVLVLGDTDTNGSGSYRARGNRIQDLGDPVDLHDAVNKQYMTQALADLAADGSGQFVVERLADLTDPNNGAAMVAANDGASGSLFTTVQGFITRLRASATAGSGAAVVGADDGASGSLFTTVQGFITWLLGYVNFKWSTLTDSAPSDPSSALKIRAVTAGRRGEIQIVPNDGDGTNVAGQRDQAAGGEVTIMGYDVNGALGFSNNIATTLRYARVDGTCQSFDIATFKSGSQTDVPTRFLNDAKGYTVQISEVTGKLIASFGVRSGDGIGAFPQANPLPAFAASGDQPAYDFEERPTAGGAILNQWRIRLISGNLDIQNLSNAQLQFRITAAGHVQMPNLGTINTDSGANKPNAYIDPSTGELKRATYTKIGISGAATDAASTQTLVNQLRTVIINYGLAQ